MPQQPQALFIAFILAVLTCIPTPAELQRPECTPEELHYGMCFAKNPLQAVKLQRSAAVQNEIKAQVDAAKAYLQNIEPSSKKVITVDLDETFLDTSGYTLKNPVFEFETWEKFHSSKAGRKYNKPVVDLIKYAQEKGFGVMFITGRPAYQGEMTWKQVNIVKWDGGFLKPFTQHHPPSSLYKSETRKLLKTLGFEVVLNIGDQFSDFDLPIEPKDGEFLLPNVLYKIY